MSTFDPQIIKKDFPILSGRSESKMPLCFLDSAASSQSPTQVTESMDRFVNSSYANVHRGVYDLAEKATNGFENARSKIADFIGAVSSSEVIFTKNTTESINLVANSWGRANLGPGDKIATTVAEHHANIVPWQQLAEETGATLEFVKVDQQGRIQYENSSAIKGAKLVAFAAMSNVTGAVVDVANFASAASAEGAVVLVDAAQWAPHHVMEMSSWGADFVAFSAHKMLGPTGLGILWGKEDLLDKMPPFLGGGGMISNVTTEGFTAAPLPAKFEAGTPPIVETIGLAAAIDYLSAVGMDNIWRHEQELTRHFLESVPAALDDAVKIYGPSEAVDRGAVFSFELRDIHAHDVAQVLNQHGVCVRPGHHCAKPLMAHFGTPATARASFYLYNTLEDVDTLVSALCATRDFFKLT